MVGVERREIIRRILVHKLNMERPFVMVGIVFLFLVGETSSSSSSLSLWSMVRSSSIDGLGDEVITKSFLGTARAFEDVLGGREGGF